MLAQILGVPIVGVFTTLLYAASLETHDGDCVLVAFDAKKNRVFGALYHKTESFYEEILMPGDYLPDELVAEFPDHTRIIAIGNGAERYRDIFCAGGSVADITPDGVKGIAVVLHLYEQSPDKFLNYNDVIPCYARKSDAEALHEAKSKPVGSH